MPRDFTSLNIRFGDDAEAVLRFSLSGALGRIALVSSFGAESVVLLHMVSEIAPKTPVIFIDTLLLFPETMTYQQEIAEKLGLSDLRIVTPDRDALFAKDPDAVLHRSDPDACCELRKTQPLAMALEGFDGWITGRKREQGGARAELPMFERGSGPLKINPLAAWNSRATSAYMDRHALPRHPLVAKGYASIGCGPCTGPVGKSEDPRAGRWRGQEKTECGIHIEEGRVIRRKAS